MIIMKRKRTEIPATVKKRICELKNGNGKITRQVYVEVGLSTVTDILANNAKWQSVNVLTSSAKATRDRKPQHQLLEDSFIAWFTQTRNVNVSVFLKITQFVNPTICNPTVFQ